MRIINTKHRPAFFSALISGLCIASLLIFSGCDDKASKVGLRKDGTAPPKKVAKTVTAVEAAAAIQETPAQEGYIYDQRKRRDPFVPLIILKKDMKKKEIVKTGTLESYDMGEFSLSAIIKKGNENYALVVAPDNRSFTINVGTVIGFNKGKVEEITGEKVVLVEYSKDYKGRLRPRRITMDFRKGE